MTPTIAGLARELATTRADHPYLHFEGETFTYADLDQRSNRIASALAASGVGPGDRVSILEKNTRDHIEVMFGASKCGAIYVPVNWRLAPKEIAAVVADAQPSILISGGELTPSLEPAVVEFGGTRVTIGDAHGSFAAFEAWLGSGDGADPGAETGPDDIALMHYTSGTTGLPKGVMLTNVNLLEKLGESARLWGYSEDSVNLILSPLFHIGGSATFLLSPLTGSTAVVLRMAEPDKILAAVDDHGVTNGLVVPAIIGMLLNTPGCEETNWSNMRTLMYGASPISEAVLKRAMSVMRCDFVQLYGMTEHSGCVTYLKPEDHDPEGRPGLLRSCGKAMPWAEVAVVAPDSLEPVPTGEVGEVAVRSAQVMKGYWNQPETTAATVSEDGWLRTGDAGYFDADGFLYLHDRIKDMIVSGGENIFPAEIENVLSNHEAIGDAAVIGIPHEKWGETPHAVVVLRDGFTLDDELEAAIIAFCREDLAGYKCPTSVETVAELPRNPAGKVLKRELRESAWADHGRLVG